MDVGTDRSGKGMDTQAAHVSVGDTAGAKTGAKTGGDVLQSHDAFAKTSDKAAAKMSWADME